jgi:glyoxalase family protein
VLPLVDPHGLRLSLVESQAGAPRPFTPWDHSTVPAERQVRGLHTGRLWERDGTATVRFVTEVLGFAQLGTEDGWTRYGFEDAAGAIDIREARDVPRGAWGVGSVHHLAWRVDDEEHQLAVRAQVEATGIGATPVIDRFWFKSVYFREPGGVLFELATDGPGFAADEDPAHLGETLVLPPWLEQQRKQIEGVLPPLRPPQ